MTKIPRSEVWKRAYDEAEAKIPELQAEISRLREAIRKIVREAEAVEFEPEGVCHFRVLTCRWDALEEIAREEGR